MNKSLWMGVAIGAAIAVGAGAMAGYALRTRGSQSSPDAASAGAGPASSATQGAGSGARSAYQGGGHASRRSGSARYATVVQVVPLTHQVVTPRQQCRDVTVTHTKPAADTHQILGSVAGAVIGGLIGHQIGGGTGKDVATVAGAAAGGYAGNRIEHHIQSGDTYTTTEHRCRTVYDKTLEPNGYEVHYRLNGHDGTVRMDHAPGRRIPVENGQLVLNQGGQST